MMPSHQGILLQEDMHMEDRKKKESTEERVRELGQRDSIIKKRKGRIFS